MAQRPGVTPHKNCTPRPDFASEPKAQQAQQPDRMTHGRENGTNRRRGSYLGWLLAVDCRISLEKGGSVGNQTVQWQRRPH
jgi:hypothetical protein